MRASKKRIVMKDGIPVVVMRYEKWFVTGFGTTKVSIIHHTPKKLFERGKVKLAWRT